jgi:hypothetical protein
MRYHQGYSILRRNRDHHVRVIHDQVPFDTPALLPNGQRSKYLPLHADAIACTASSAGLRGGTPYSICIPISYARGPHSRPPHLLSVRL